MDLACPDKTYRDRSLILYLIGAPLLLIGLVAAFYGPAEMYCFYLFEEGGRFAYPGFRFGSFMVANLAAQIAGYYALAALLIPLGYGHLARRRWVRPLALALLGFWRLLGLPPREIEMLDGVPLQGVHLAAFLGAAFLLPLGWLAVSKKHFARDA